MTITANNSVLQSSVAFIAQEQKGVVAQERLTVSYDIDGTDQTTALKYGDFVGFGQTGGVKYAASTVAASSLVGIVPYLNSGIIDQQGYDDAFYTNVPVLKQGLVWVACSGAIDIDTVLSYQGNGGLVVPAATTTGHVSLSGLAKVVKKPAATTTSLCLIDLNII